MAFRLVVSDIDGTLLDERGMLSSETRRVVAEVVKAGITFVLATSRRWTGTLPVAQALDLCSPLIIYDGMQTRQFPSGCIIAEEQLDSGIAGQAALIMAKQRLQPILQYSDFQSERLVVGLLPDGEASHANHAAHYLSNNMHQVQEVPLDDVARSQLRPLRVVAFGPYDRLLAVADDMAPLHCGLQILPNGSYGAAELTVFAPNGSKGAAIQTIGRQLGITPEEVFAIGDGPNDVSLLSAAGFGVAMANGAEETKAVARAVAPSNRQDGVAVAIRRYVLGDAR